MADHIRPAIARANVDPAVPNKVITIYHHGRGYKPRRPILRLFVCPVNPDGPKDAYLYQLPLELVLQACKLLANNMPGTLWQSAANLEGTTEISSEMVDAPGQYRYRVDGQADDYRYKICRKFSFWDPEPDPTDNVPSSWLFDNRVSDENDIQPQTAASHASTAVKMSDEVCVITQSPDRLDSAHLVPSSEGAWFIEHNFSLAAGDLGNFTVDSPNNQLTLQHDINGRGLDQAHFCFYPYNDRWVIMWMGQGSFQMAKRFNFREVTLPPRLRAAYLFARFAWNIFFLSGQCIKNQQGLDFTDDSVDDGNDDAEYREGDDEDDQDDQDEDDEDEGHGGHKSRGKPSSGGGRGDGRGRGNGGDRGSRGRRRGGGQGGQGPPPAPTRIQPKRAPTKKRHATAQLPGQTTKRTRRDLASENIPDLSYRDPKYIQQMKKIDGLVQAGKVPYTQNSDWYPGFSHAAELAYSYKLSHPAATDPGCARIAFVSEREEA
ncbi:hypothetical protein B0H13DRAFT_2031482 [Mycena leptocephala]|nr:hypothetical protein B0H13DRAFT_2031482 [Mycena leptocephala]